MEFNIIAIYDEIFDNGKKFCADNLKDNTLDINAYYYDSKSTNEITHKKPENIVGRTIND